VHKGPGALCLLVGGFRSFGAGIGSNTEQIQHLDNNMDWLQEHSVAMTQMSQDIWDFSKLVLANIAAITALKDRVGELEIGHRVLWDCVAHIEEVMDVDLPGVNLTDSNDNKTTNETSNKEGSSSSGSSSDNSDLYDNGRQIFLSVPIIDVDENPTGNIKPIPVHGPFMAMLPGPSVLRSLIPIEEGMDVLNDPRFIPPFLHGNLEAGPDVEVKEGDKSEGEAAGTLEFWAGDYE
jgi:hypothetical protein